jgi:hypothetical protein
MKLPSKIRKLVSSPCSLPIVILFVSVLAYGIHIPWMGFYWDDWPWVWFSHVMGPGGMLKIDVEHRPISGMVLFLGTILSGENPLGWQVYNLVIRIFGGLSLGWTLKVLWPDHKEQTNWVVILFLVYPGFSQQFVAVNTSRHLFPLASFSLSLGFMIRANQVCNHSRWFSGASLVLGLLTMFTTEYYYGLEFIRPVILWIYYRKQGKERQNVFRQVCKSWLPYLLPLMAVFAWRYAVSKSSNYAIIIGERLTTDSDQGIIIWLGAAVQDVIAAGLEAWEHILQLPDPGLFGGRTRLYYWGLAGLTTFGTWTYCSLYPSKTDDKSWGIEAFLLGAGALVLGPIPFWVTGLDIKLSFPFDRLTLPMMVGSSLLLAGTVDIITRSKAVKVILIAAITGLAVGYHFQNGIAYRRDWQHQTQFFQQLTWRIPALETNTALLSNELPSTFSTDNSLTAPLNWIYAPNFSGGNLPVYLFYIDLRFGSENVSLTPGRMAKDHYRFYPFRGTPDRVVVILNHPPGCLRVLSPEYHRDFPDLPPDVEAVLAYSNLDRIHLKVDDSVPQSPLNITNNESDWCYYFEKADLARQFEAWETVAELSDQAFKVGYPDSPAKHVDEYEVFIEGYAHNDQWETAQQLTLEAIKINPLMAGLLCDTWERVRSSTPSSPERSNILETLSMKLNCEIPLE